MTSVESQPGQLETAVRAALDAHHAQPADAGTVELALTYARGVDLGDDLAKLGPPLLATLSALGMTPAARAALAKRGADDPAGNPLDELRARRAARADRTSTVDTAAP